MEPADLTIAEWENRDFILIYWMVNENSSSISLLPSCISIVSLIFCHMPTKANISILNVCYLLLLNCYCFSYNKNLLWPKKYLWLIIKSKTKKKSPKTITIKTILTKHNQNYGIESKPIRFVVCLHNEAFDSWAETGRTGYEHKWNPTHYQPKTIYFKVCAWGICIGLQ